MSNGKKSRASVRKPSRSDYLINPERQVRTFQVHRPKPPLWWWSFTDDGNTITAYWERSTDGSSWERDFDMFYYPVTPGTNVQAMIK